MNTMKCENTDMSLYETIHTINRVLPGDSVTGPLPEYINVKFTEVSVCLCD